jgi:hypothetical protein
MSKKHKKRNRDQKMATKRDTANDALLIKTATTLQLMNERLFGGPGMPDGGAIHFIMGQHRALEEKMEENKKEVLEKIDEKKKETDECVEKVEKKQDDLEAKFNRIIITGSVLNSMFIGMMAWLGWHHKT